jgi:hypothetical protein
MFNIGDKVQLQKLRARSNHFNGKTATVKEFHEHGIIVETEEKFSAKDEWLMSFGKPSYPAWFGEDQEVRSKKGFLVDAKQLKLIKE